MCISDVGPPLIVINQVGQLSGGYIAQGGRTIVSYYSRHLYSACHSDSPCWLQVDVRSHSQGREELFVYYDIPRIFPSTLFGYDFCLLASRSSPNRHLTGPPQSTPHHLRLQASDLNSLFFHSSLIIHSRKSSWL